MKNLNEYLNESLVNEVKNETITFTTQGINDAINFSDRLVNNLNRVRLTNTKPVDRDRFPGEFYLTSDKSDFKDESYYTTRTKYTCRLIRIKSESLTSKDGYVIDPSVFSVALKQFFKIDFKFFKLLESLMDTDKDILKKSKDTAKIMDYFRNIHDVITKTFKISNFNLELEGYYNPPKLEDKSYPTLNYNNIYIRLVNVWIDCFGSFNITIALYENKPQDMLDAELAARQAKKEETKNKICTDCAGREIKVGDTVAYDYRTASRGPDPWLTGKVESVAAYKIKVDGTYALACRSCIISRSDGRRIE